MFVCRGFGLLAAGPSQCDAGAACWCVGGVDCGHIWQKAYIFLPTNALLCSVGSCQFRERTPIWTTSPLPHGSPTWLPGGCFQHICIQSSALHLIFPLLGSSTDGLLIDFWTGGLHKEVWKMWQLISLAPFCSIVMALPDAYPLRGSLTWCFWLCNFLLSICQSIVSWRALLFLFWWRCTGISVRFHRREWLLQPAGCRVSSAVAL